LERKEEKLPHLIYKSLRSQTLENKYTYKKSIKGATTNQLENSERKLKE